ncbi:MAG: ABC transporter permease [Planctomycetota bacterium]|nr:ABC transporter permease [Planctomycetota bacterium]
MPTTDVPTAVQSRSYGEIVWRQLRKRPGAMVSLVIIAILAVSAIMAPFIAGEVPIRWVEKGEVSWPIFHYLTAWEYAAIAALLLAPALPLTARLLRRRAERKGASAWKWTLLTYAGVLLALALVLLAARTTERRYGFYLERANEAESAWFPLVPTARFPGYESLPGKNQPPSWKHPLGTDRLGQDILLLVLYGARTAMTIGFVAVGIGAGIGVTLGAISGYFGKWVDLILMRVAEIVMFIPQIVLIIIILAVMPSWVPPLWAVVFVIGVTGWTGYYRYMRAELLRIRDEDYMTAARALGIPTWRLLLRHAVPNGMAPILVAATFGIAGAIFIEVNLAFLNLVQTPSWGELLNDGRQHLETWWAWGSAGAAIFITVLLYNLLGEAVRDAIDPKLKI